MTHVVLVLAGDAPESADWPTDAEHVIAADGGYRHCLAQNITPDAVVGDLDGLDGVDLSLVNLERHPTAKDETDGELALARCLALTPERLTIIGGHGGRTAMFLANLKLLRRAHDEGVDATMVHGHETLYFVTEGERRTWPAPGCTVNVLAVGGAVRITTTGTAWDVEQEILEPTTARGVSNQVVGPGHIDVHEGVALVSVEA